MPKSIYTAKFKSDRVLEILNGEETIETIASKHNLHPNMLRKWKKDFIDRAPELFEDAKQRKEAVDNKREVEEERDELLKTVGQLTIERDWLKKKSSELLGPEYEKRFNK